MNGWRLLGSLTVLLGVLVVILGSSHGWDVEGLRLAIRATARTSLLLFALAFTAGPLLQLAPNEGTRWLRRNRRYLGLAFAISHFVHLGVIVVLALTDRALFWTLTNLNTVVLAGAAYLFIAAMAVTSFDRTAAWLGPRRWRLLHLVGGWYIWVSFAVAVGKRVPLDAFYWPMAVVVVAIAAVRLVAMRRRSRRQVQVAG
ncbi:MAG: hypothetical protein LCH95_07000 [Proteobacteria bacterium]|nr:hypothetical protein [Pseudomonadota bacterium]